MQISLRDLIIPLLGSQTWPAGLFQGPPLQVCFHYSQLRIAIPWISSIECVSTTDLFFNHSQPQKCYLLDQPLLQLFFAIEGFFQTFHYIFQPLQVCLNHSQPLKYHSLDLFNRVKAITASANPRAAAMFR